MAVGTLQLLQKCLLVLSRLSREFSTLYERHKKKQHIATEKKQ